MPGAVRFLVGLVLLPVCWAVTSVLVGLLSSVGGIGACSFAFLGGLMLFAVCWAFLPHPVKAYVLGHELTHAIWGLLFGARPSRLKVGASGGSVNLTKTNLLITLAPYFFPFYTFLVLLAALVTGLFVRPLPLLPLWSFLVGFTWAFHVLFTLQSLACEQPDIAVYGRIFSWAFIYLVNVLLVLFAFAAATGCGLPGVFRSLLDACAAAYVATWEAIAWCAHRAVHTVRSLVNR